MTKIATAGTQEAVELFRSLLLASAAIPGAFPPVAVKVVANGNSYTELHVDGGTTVNAFVAPLNAHFPKAGRSRNEHLYTVMDGKLGPEYQRVNPKTLKISERAIGTLLKYKNYADIRRLYLLAKQREGNFQLISIPDDFNVKSKGAFDKAYMNQLYDLGFRMGKSGQEWISQPDIF